VDVEPARTPAPARRIAQRVRGEVDADAHRDLPDDGNRGRPHHHPDDLNPTGRQGVMSKATKKAALKRLTKARKNLAALPPRPTGDAESRRRNDEVWAAQQAVRFGRMRGWQD
jgi:hypothetical protein